MKFRKGWLFSLGTTEKASQALLFQTNILLRKGLQKSIGWLIFIHALNEVTKR